MRNKLLQALMLGVAGVGTLTLPGTAQARGRTEITPYVALDQGVVANLKGGTGDDVVTYTALTAGVDAHYQTRRVEVGASLLYSHQFNWDKGTPDSNVYSGLARARVGIIGDTLNLEGGALATRVRSGRLTGANGTILGGDTSQVYSFYAGPTVTTHVGDIAVNGAYRFGYNKLEGNDGVPGSPDRFDSSTNHFATASVGQQPGDLPFGWSVGGAWMREDATELDQRFEGKNARLDITVPVTMTLAVIAGVGYETIKISHRDALRDNAGNAVIGSDGRFVTNKAGPRLLAYDQDGIIYDAGVLWKPSRRTSASAYIGKRYGSTTFGATASWHPESDTSLSLAVFDQMDSFGRRLNTDLAGLSTDFTVNRNPFSRDLTGCATGQEGGGGICLNNSLTALGSGNFRSRGVAVAYNTMLGAWRYGAGAGYARRKFVAARGTVLAVNNGVVDQNWYALMSAGRAVGSNGNFDTNVYFNQFKGNSLGSIDVTNIGANASYAHSFTSGLSGTLAVGVDSVRPEGQQDFMVGLAQLGMRYSF